MENGGRAVSWNDASFGSTVAALMLPGRGTNMAKIADDWQKMAEKADKAEQKKTQALEREAALIAMLFDAPAVACETQLRRTLGVAR